MKKFFTLLGVAAIAASSLLAEAAEPNFTLVGLKKSPAEVGQMLQPINMNEAQQTQKRVVRKSWESGQFVYDAYIVNQGVVTDYWNISMKDEDGNQHPATFNDLPYYAVQIQIVRNRKTNPSEQTQNLYNFFATWPSKAKLSNPDFTESVEITPENKGIASVEEFASNPDIQTHMLINQSVDDNSIYNVLPVYGEIEGVAVFCGYPMWGRLLSGFYSTIGGNKYQISNAMGESKLIINTAKNGEGTDVNINMTMSIGFENPSNANDMQELSGEYDGLATAMDMSLFNFVYNFDEFHIFNGGLLESEGSYEETFTYPFTYPQGDDSFTPVYRYYYMGAQTPGVVWLNKATVFDTANIVYAVDDAENVDPNTIRYVRGGFFSANDAFENMQFSMIMPEFYTYIDPNYNQQNTLLLMSPLSGSLLPGGYTDAYGDWSDVYGSFGVAHGYYRYFYDATYLAFNTKDGIVFNANDSKGNTYSAKFNGKVVYHYDPKDMNNIREIGPLTGDFVPSEVGVEGVIADADFSVIAANGNISVASEGEMVRVFNLNGQLIGSAKGNASFNVAKGMYIVVVGKNVKKVIL